MKNLAFGVSALAVSLALSASAFAADLQSELYVPEAAAVEDWSGFYLGGVVGAGLFTSTMVDNDENISYGYSDLTDWGGSAGVTAGYNVQFGAGVVGVEADINWSSFSNSFYDEAYDTQHDRSWEWYSTIRGRAGLAVDKALFYGTAGLVIASLDFKGDYDPENDCGDYYGYCLTGTQVGLALGAGAEFMVSDNLSVKVEGLYLGLPTSMADDVYTEDANNYQLESHVFVARAGLNLHF
jgi:outer membrane immunogenic protein